MNNFIKLIFLFAVLSSCSPYLYSPEPLNMPLPDHKDEVKANIYYGSNGGGLQGSYAIDSNFVLIGDFAFVAQKPANDGIPDPDPEHINNLHLSFGGGYFSSFGNHGRFEILAGGGFGNANAHAIDADRTLTFDDFSRMIDIRANYMHLFGQVDIGSMGQNAEIAFGLRARSLFLTYGKYQVTTDAFFGPTDPLPSLSQNLSGEVVFAEPCLRAGVGFEKVRLNLSMGYSFRVFGHDIPSSFGTMYQPFFISTGISVNLFAD